MDEGVDHDHDGAHHHHDVAPDGGDKGHDHDGHDHGGHDHAHGGGDHIHRGGIVGLIQSVFAPHSHDAADQVDAVLESSARGIWAVKVSLLGLLVTSGLQVMVVLVSGSVGLLADTIHNFSDALTAIPLWIAFSIGTRAATKRFTYGYRRGEDIAALFVLVMIIGSSVLAAWTSIDRLFHPDVLSNLALVAVAGLIGFAGNEAVATYRIRVGNEIGSAALVTDGYHARTDGLTSLAVVIGAAGVWLGFPAADPIVGLLITVVILWVLKSAATQVFGRLMDAVDPAVTEAVERAAAAVPGVESVASVRIRWIGHQLEAEAHVVVDADLPTIQSHGIAESVRHSVFHAVSKISDVLVHIDPCTHAVADPHRTTRAHLPPAPRAAI
jgi:cation diffusion facilitator family transporter